MTQTFEEQKTALIEDYERRLRELEAMKDKAYKGMETKLQKEITELKELLRQERENMQGNAQEMRKKMQDEIDDLKRQLFERTGQLEVASCQILERNQEIKDLRLELEGHLSYISELEDKIKKLEDTLKNSMLGGQEIVDKLKGEIERLKAEIEALKLKNKEEL